MIKFISMTMLVFMAGSSVKAQTASVQTDFRTSSYETPKDEKIQAWIKPVSDESSSFTLQVLNPSGKRIKVSIEQEGFQTLLNESFSSTNFSKVYNLSELEDGVYRFRIANAREEIVRKVEISTKTTIRRVVNFK